MFSFLPSVGHESLTVTKPYNLPLPPAGKRTLSGARLGVLSIRPILFLDHE